ncbi:hypothetical protein LOAG_01698 [Loa loa]|uniref:Uncharacterized protein n=1 Tax=Loa loa TaxID=7209 RepID=A0A1S0UAA4_LOALO|nr:hypothetical protein LOAG_01698 [Loa loa]EFO26781.2 hypothetical protein LOAG_01698 [Loa loa]
MADLKLTEPQSSRLIKWFGNYHREALMETLPMSDVQIYYYKNIRTVWTIKLLPI